MDVEPLACVHHAAGNSQHLPNAAVALLSFLACVEFFPDDTESSLERRISMAKMVPVAANGRCLFSCFYVSSLTPEEIETWLGQDRNSVGFAVCRDREQYEETVVKAFFDDVFAAAVNAEDGFAAAVKATFDAHKMPEHEEIKWVVQALKCHVKIVGSTQQVLQEEGDQSYPLVVLSNVGSADGAGKIASHFQLIYLAENAKEEKKPEKKDAKKEKKTAKTENAKEEKKAAQKKDAKEEKKPEKKDAKEEKKTAKKEDAKVEKKETIKKDATDEKKPEKKDANHEKKASCFWWLDLI
jgi:hypothetical protein